MKNIGMTQEGNHLVEMNKWEYAEFVKLQSAVEGRSFAEYPLTLTPYEYQYRMDFDFTKVFEVIRAYYANKFHLNEFQRLLDDVKNSLEKKEN
jgi:hypothetical protein